MINLSLTRINEWIEARNNRERILITLGCFAVIYALWFFLISRPMSLEENGLRNQISLIKNEINVARDQAAVITRIATQYSINQKLEVNKMLFVQSESLKKNIEGSTLPLDSTNKIVTLLKDLLMQPTRGVTLINIKNLGEGSLIPPGVDITNLPSILKNITKHGMQVEIRSDYFNTIRYLGLLEKLPWRLYWDSLEYRVMDYPQAQIRITFYILMNIKNS